MSNQYEFRYSYKNKIEQERLDSIYTEIIQSIDKGELSINDISRAIKREKKLKKSRKEVLKKNRQTERSKLEEDLKKIIDDNVFFNGEPKNEFESNLGPIVSYIKSKLKNTSFHRLRNNITNWICEKYPIFEDMILEKLKLHEYCVYHKQFEKLGRIYASKTGLMKI